ncbi:putative aarF domain-containing protein kinase 1 [Iris pallida]|uniref:AarF domain-containing protein kinase 1 n=1 Tax=Iris pallida TaxID=29817 RepID=A0AAX6EMP2_IRIPA|nr:putative aarF domain-containing protein kinase 1 [Iris pallida]
MATSHRRLKILAVGIAGAAAWKLGTDYAAGDPSVSVALDGVVRSSRAIYTIGYVVVDYKYSMRGLEPQSKEYRSKISEVHLRSARKLLKLCEANKGFYVKAGQFISSLRQVPKEYSSTLSTLQDQAIPYNFNHIKEVIIKNLGKDLSEVFLSFDEQPIAAASIAQVHRGLLKDKQEVAVKVQYPGLEQRMKIDITTMDILSKSISWVFPDYRFQHVVSEFERAISMELDFVQEAKNSERAARNFKKNSIIKFPHIFWDLTTNQVLTMQFCNGHKVDDLEFLKESGINPIKVAKALMEAFAEMIFVHGFLHGDPHPGNILVCPQGGKNFSLVLLDHGIYRELDEGFRLNYCQLWKALILLDSQKIQNLGERFGVGKYSKYFPVIFTGRTMESKSALGTQMSDEERRNLKQELRHLRMDDISSFMESLPPDFLSILKTDGLLRSIVSRLGAPRRVRLLAYAKYAVYGLRTQSDTEGLTVKYAISKISSRLSYLQLRALVEILGLFSQMEDLRNSTIRKLKRMLHRIFSLIYSTVFFLQF